MGRLAAANKYMPPSLTLMPNPSMINVPVRIRTGAFREERRQRRFCRRGLGNTPSPSSSRLRRKDFHKVGNIPIIAGFRDGESYASTRSMPDLSWQQTGAAARHWMALRFTNLGGFGNAGCGFLNLATNPFRSVAPHSTNEIYNWQAALRDGYGGNRQGARAVD
jgi:hypothetical protein